MTGAAAQIGRLWRTVRWLRAEQVWGRLRLHLPRPRPDARPAPPRRRTTGRWVPPAARQASLMAGARMDFLGQQHDLDRVGWDDPQLPLLWRYNQHYFDDLNAAGAAQRHDAQRALIVRWLAENPPGRGTACAPFPTSLRIVNWVKWFLGGSTPEPAWLDSLALQARWLTQRLEWHLLGNHLFANAKALVFAGLYFEGAEAEHWLACGLDILARELPEQLLSDGGHFERSPMYHVLALEDLLDLLNLVECQAPAHPRAGPLASDLRRHSAAMLRWLRLMTHPGGSLARFNDCAEGIAPSGAEIQRYAAALGVSCEAADPARTTDSGDGITVLQPSGYLRAQRAEVVALLDLAPIGPDYLPGHAHADTLSFELSLRGREFIVNRGTSVYGSGARRLLERGTAAHSTVQLGGRDSSEVWSGFRVGRRARPGPVQAQGWTVDGSHDGYGHLPGRPQHHRRWHFEDAALTVDDRIDPAAAEAAVARFHLAPGLRLEAIDTAGTRWRVLAGATPCASVEVLVGAAQVEPWQHALRFGRLVEASTLAVTLERGAASVRWCWTT